MAIARKDRRTIDVEGREFLWWVYEELEEAAAMTLAVASADKRFLVRYPLDQPDDSRHLIVLGREFPGLPNDRGSWARVRCPQWTSGKAVKPSVVRRLIEWCLHSERELVQLDWRGRELVVAAAEGQR
jgi:hypothetical protein